MSDLAIIIPAYKEKYFTLTLESLARQTDKNFRVYVGDDHSPYDLKRICDRFTDRLPLDYTRFDTNIGAKNLVHQWTRCIKLAKDEHWLWVFSDDDLIDPGAVADYYAHLEATERRFDVYRFNTTIIDGDGRTLCVTPKGPPEESSAEMAYHLLMGERGNSLADHIFRREVYERCGGFVFTEYAQGADWAMSISFSRFRGISIIPNSNFYWRYSGENISARPIQTKREMLNGHLQFLRWVVQHFKSLRSKPSAVSDAAIMDAVRFNLRHVIVGHYKELTLRNTRLVADFLTNELGLSKADVAADIFRILSKTEPSLLFAARIARRLRRPRGFLAP